MMDNRKHLQTIALDHIKQIAKTVRQSDEVLINQLLDQLYNSGSNSLADQDFKMVVNQLYNTARFGPLTELELFLTEDCNLRCEYCFVKEMRANSISLETAKAAINFLVFYSGQKKDLNITFFGGEPLLEIEKVIELIDYCDTIETETKSKKFFHAMTTNGTLLNEDILKRIQGKLNILLSIDGDEETHDKYRKNINGKGSFQSVISKLELIKKYQPWLGTRMTILPDTVHKLFHNVKFLYNLGINQFILGVASDSEWDEGALNIYERELLRIGQYYFEMKEKGEQIRMTFFEKSENEINGQEAMWGCRAGRQTISVNTKGDIYPCSKFLGYEEYECPEIRMGNIFEGITNIDFRKKMTEMKSDSYLQCMNCKEIDSCMGGCPAISYYKNRNIYNPCSSECEITKVQNRVLRKFLKSDEVLSIRAN